VHQKAPMRNQKKKQSRTLRWGKKKPQSGKKVSVLEIGEKKRVDFAERMDNSAAKAKKSGGREKVTQKKLSSLMNKKRRTTKRREQRGGMEKGWAETIREDQNEGTRGRDFHRMTLQNPF